jgi:hypothetical protein
VHIPLEGDHHFRLMLATRSAQVTTHSAKVATCSGK